MIELVRDSTVGQIINKLSDGRLLPYADQRPGYVLPERYCATSTSCPQSRAATIRGDFPSPKRVSSENVSGFSTPPTAPEVLTSDNASMRSVVPGLAILREKNLEEGSASFETLQAELEAAKANPYLVDWNGPNDPDNPRNWSFFKRSFVAFSISLLTFSVYIGSAIYTSSIPSLMEDFGISQTQGSLGLSLYVLAYGIGPMFLTPLQELPSLGRNPVYIIGLTVFVLFNIPIATANNFSTILAFRFLTGLVGSPALATGGASMGDIFPPQQLPYVIGIWALGGVAGPVTGPVIGGFAAQAKGWCWPIYELTWISGFALVFLAFFLPETLGSNILLKRAQRLRKLTGNPNLRSQSEIDQASLSYRAVIYDSLVRPFLLASEPAVFFFDLYTGLIYSVFYLWFEAFPLVFNEMYHMNLGVGSLPFVGFVVSGSITYAAYCLYLRYHLVPRYTKAGFLAPEAWLEIGLMASVFIPISLFMFGWSSRPSVHWIVPVVAAALYLPGIFLAFQSIMTYLSISYTKYTASVFAGNSLFRSSMASVFPLFGTAFFKNLGVGPGCSLLAGVSIGLVPIFFLLVRYGSNLRARSRYADS